MMRGEFDTGPIFASADEFRRLSMRVDHLGGDRVADLERRVGLLMWAAVVSLAGVVLLLLAAVTR